METTTLSTLADLLKQKSANNSSPSVTSEQNEGNNSATILDLCGNDRYRVLRVIEELLDTQEEVDKLRQKSEEDKSEFREKRSKLLKKLDVTNEKYDRAASELEMLKDRHTRSLTNLEEKISSVSIKFEVSVSEIMELRKANAELKQENMALRKLNNESTATLSTIKGENIRLTMQLELAKHKEKTLNKHLKKLTSLANGFSARNSNFSSLAALSERSTSAQTPGEILYGRDAGQGDGEDLTTIRPSASLSDVNAIKAPTKGSFQPSNISTFAFPSNSKIESSVASSRKFTTLDHNGNNTYSLEDMAILENLFFRF